MNTLKLNDWLEGNLKFDDDFFEEVYPLLKRLVHSQLKNNKNLNLNTTQLVNDAFLRINEIKGLKINDKLHFKRLFSKFVRRMIIDEARIQSSQKAGGHFQFVGIEEIDNNFDPENKTDYIQVHYLLNQLEQVDRQSAAIIELRFYGGLTIKEIALMLNCSEPTISRQWQFAKTWLKNKINN